MRRRLPLRPIAALLATLPSAACGAGWRAVTVEPREVPPRQQAQLWVAAGPLQVHGLRVTGDSISGIPFLQPLACDSCRVAFPRAEVDSVRFGDPTGGFWSSAGLGILALLGVMVALCMTHSPDCPVFD